MAILCSGFLAVLRYVFEVKYRWTFEHIAVDNEGTELSAGSLCGFVAYEQMNNGTKRNRN